MRWTTLLPVISIAAAAHADGAAVRLATTPQREQVVLLLGKPPEAIVRESRTVSLPAGETSLVLGWAGTRLVADSVTLSAADADTPITISGPVLLADRAQHAEWTITAPDALEAELVLSYVMLELKWEPQYSIALTPDANTLALTAVAAVTNRSGEDFEDARIDLGIGATLEADIKRDATLRVPYITATDVPCRLVHVYNSEASPDTQLRLELLNDRDSGLGVAPLPPGKARIFETVGGQELLMGEVRLPHVPVGAALETNLGTAREVTVERRVIGTRQIDVKKDVHGRMALWNQEDEVNLLIESRTETDVLLRITEKIAGEWRMQNNSHEFEQVDAEHIEFVVPVPAHGELIVRYKVRRMNLTP